MRAFSVLFKPSTSTTVETTLLLCVKFEQKLLTFDDELPKLKEVTTILELTMWKLRIDEIITQEEATNIQKKVMTDESSIRRECRVTCGADVVICHVLPYLIAH